MDRKRDNFHKFILGLTINFFLVSMSSGKSDGRHLVSVKGLDWEGFMMNCNRCGGVMVYEKFYGSQETFWGWRCISCGEILDQIILENRGGRVVRARIAKSLMARGIKMKKDYRTPLQEANEGHSHAG